MNPVDTLQKPPYTWVTFKDIPKKVGDMHSHKADASTVRVVNRTFILNLLRQEGSLTRVQLKSLTGLSGSAITSVVGSLINDGIVVETQAGPSRGGRPPVFLTLNYQARAAIGIKLMEHGLLAVLTDAGANIEQGLFLPLPDTQVGRQGG